MINSLEITNFKAISGSQNIPIKPITLLFGKNSAGKSTVIQALALLNEAVRLGGINVSVPKIGNGWIDLGGFMNFIHKHDKCLPLKFRIQFSTSNLHPFLKLHAPKNSKIAVELEFGFMVPLPEYDDTEGQYPELLGIKLYRNNKKILTLSVYGNSGFHDGGQIPDSNSPSSRESVWTPFENQAALMKATENMIEYLKEIEAGPRKEWLLVQLDFRDPLFQHALMEAFETRGVMNWNVDIIKSLTPEAIRKMLYGLVFSTSGLLPSEYSHFDPKIKRVEPYQFPSDSLIGSVDESTYLAAVMGRVLGTLMEAVRVQFEGDLRRLLYIGPIRQFPERGIRPKGIQQSDDPMLQAWHELANNDELRSQVNDWLGSPDKLNTQYQFKIKKYFSDTLIEKKILFAMDVIQENMDIKVGDPGYDECLAKEVPEMLSSLDRDRKGELCMVDRRFETEVNHRDVGFGISQITPILAACLGSRGKTICIEQPEIHIHPGLQADLADLFIESAKIKGNQLIVETHSEHLILRILRRIKESDGTGSSISAQDVAVLYVDSDEGGCFIKEIPITKDGEFASRWPHGFFTERFKEVFF